MKLEMQHSFFLVAAIVFLFTFIIILNFLVAFGRIKVIMTALTILLAMVNVAVYKLRQVCEHEFMQDKHVQLAPDEPSCHRFSIIEILLATQNFDDAFVIGKGGFGKVYKGLLYGCPEVLAIKRLKPDSNQGAREFWREIETLSKFRHNHLVSLVGYCNEDGEMILVYEYMPRGTLADNIYKARMNGIPLSWEQRLIICIGAARGLDYLHTGTQYGFIHRDVKDTNILLDENYAAKISDFGLSKQGATPETQDQLSTDVKGTIGYLDPHYFTTLKPSFSSDVYAFGIVLLVVLSGRPALERKFHGENVSLLACFREYLEKGEMKEIIDPSIHGEISLESLTKFMKAIEKCVHHLPEKRPTMAQLVVFLEHALVKHQGLAHSAVNDDTVVGQSCVARSNQPSEFYESQVAPTTEENIASVPVEGGARKEIQNADHSIAQKPFWARRLFDFKTIRKTTKKSDMALRTANIFSLKDINLTLDTQRADLPTKVEVLQPREMVRHIAQKPWFGIKDINKPVILLKDIKSATQNFSEEFKIEKRGFYDVYKVFYSGGSGIFEIKRLNSDSIRAVKAFKAQAEFLKLGKPHINLVRLLGYCDEDNERILVNEYTPHVTLDEYFYGNSNKKDVIILSWKQRLRICRDAAHGLSHLHKSRIIHKNVNIYNIVLDNNMVSKISGFGCDERHGGGGFEHIRDTYSLLGERESDGHVEAKHYLDPSYAVTGELTESSDVYSFGVVLLVVLSGRLLVDHTFPFEQRFLKPWFTECFEKGNFEKIIDLNLEGKIPLTSLRGFAGLINNCLLVDPKSRPGMDQVVANIKALCLAQEVLNIV